MTTQDCFLGFSSDRIVRSLLQITGILIIVHLINLVLGGPSWQIERLFALGEEANIPTWFSSTLWAINALAAYRCSKLIQTKNIKFLWILIALGFLAFSIDETAMIHENVFEVMSRVLPHGFRAGLLARFKATNWPIFASPFLVLTLAWLVITFRRLLKGSHTAAKFLFLGFSTVVLGGYGLEMITNFLNHDELQWVWDIENVFEESMEMIGAIVILSGLLIHSQFLEQNQKSGQNFIPQSKSKAGHLV